MISKSLPALCIPCGFRDEDGVFPTCPRCGEGSWVPLEITKPPEPESADPKPRKGKR